jgi:hypothetical protein
MKVRIFSILFVFFICCLPVHLNAAENKAQASAFNIMITTVAAYNPNKDVFDWDYPYLFPILKCTLCSSIH